MIKHIRFTALLLAVSFLVNTAALPAMAEGSLAITPTQQEESALDAGSPELSAASSEGSAADVSFSTELSSTASGGVSLSDDLSSAASADDSATPQGEPAADSSSEVGEISSENESAASGDSSGSEEGVSVGDSEPVTPSTDGTDTTGDGTDGTEIGGGSSETDVPANGTEDYPTGTVECQSFVNIRSGPGTSYSVVGTATDGQEVTIYETCFNEDYNWGRIDPELQLWICLTYVRMDTPDDSTGATGNAGTPEGSETGSSTEGGDQPSTPTQGDEGSDTPAQGDEGSDTPAQGDEGSDTPAQGDEGSDTPAQDDEGSDTPAQGDEGSDTPAQGDEGSDTPAQDDEGSDTPAQGDEGSDTPEGDEDAIPPTADGSQEGSLSSAGTGAFALQRSYSDEYLEEVRNREIIPGQMSLFWWAVMCGQIKATAESSSESQSVSSSDTTGNEDDPSLTGDLQTPDSSASENGQSDIEPTADDPLLTSDSTTAAGDPTDSESGLDGSLMAASSYTAMSVQIDSEPSGDEPVVTSDGSAAEDSQVDSQPAGDETLQTLDSSAVDAAQTGSELTEDQDTLPSDGSTPDDGENGGNSADTSLTDETENGADTPALFAASDDPEYTGVIQISKALDLIYLSYVTPSQYQNKKIIFYNTGATTFELSTPVTDEYGHTVSFQGLSGGAPFSGDWNYASGSESTSLRLSRSLFVSLSDSATFTFANPDNRGVIMKWVGGASGSVLAERVTHGDTSPANLWSVCLRNTSEGVDTPTSLVLVPVIGTMAENSMVSLCAVIDPKADYAGSEDTSYSPTVSGGGFLCGEMAASSHLTAAGMANVPAVTNASGHAGGLVGTMGSGASLTVSSDLTIGSISATNGNAGGLVGQLSANAAITAGNVTLSTVSAEGSDKNGNAGGLVGYAENPKMSSLPAINTTSATISGRSAGGLIGWLQNSDNVTFSLSNSISSITLSGTDSSGGLFGELHNDHGDAGAAITYSISQSETGTISNITLTSGNAGGLIGKYYTNDLGNTLTIQNISVTSSSSATSYGGVIGNVDSGVPAYVAFSNVTTTTSGNVTSYGGLIGSLKDSGHMVKVGAGVSVSGDFRGTNVGGLVGSMPSGVLYIANNPEGTNSFPELTLTKLKENASAYRGWILGNRGNTLVYTDIPGWSQLPSKTSDDKESNDTGVWGQVLRVDGALKTLLTLDETAHTVTVKAPTFQDENAVTLNNSAKITNVLDFAAVALRLQLNPKGALQFEDEDFTSNSNVSITLTSDIDLNNTSLTGLTRDVNSTEVFNLSIVGNSKTITLPDLKVYASGNAHDRQGLIGKAGVLDVKNLTVGGNIQTHVLNGDIYAGALLAEASGNTTLTSVTSSIQMTISGGNSNNCAYSGLVAMASSNVSFDRCKLEASSKVSDGTDKNSYVAGFLAYGKGTITIVVTGCELHGTVEKTVNPSNYARIGGLIATLYDGNYTLDISGLTVSNLTVSVPDDFSQTCGGLLGYEWIQTTATISGVSITDCTLKAGKAMFGGLLYKGSWYWKVGNGSETAGNGISISNSSFSGKSDDNKPSGLLVCRANEENDGKGALYLEILYNAYSVGDDVTVTLASGSNFDELVGSTEGSLGNGIVSIATATASPVKIDPKNQETGSYTCNTYTNKIQKWSNPHTRYYYNLNFFRSLGALNTDGSIIWDIATVDSAEEMVLWSAWDYCDSSIQKYFIKSGVTPSTIQCEDLDLTGYSYYPVSIHSRSVTVGSSESGPTITFDFAGLETAEAGNKQPSNERSQHYGMHTGLFTDVENRSDSPKTLTVQNVTLKGTVGNSAVINGTADGSTSANLKLKFTNIHLNGICISPVPDTTPLLIQSIGSYSELDMSGVKTTGGYENGTYAASSLIGTVGSSSGTHIQLKFSNMVLDGSTTALEMPSPIYNTYHTIFKKALFLEAFDYTDGNTCSGVYNFNKDESHQYTLGRELSNNDGGPVSGRNNGLQYWFYDGIGEDDNYLVCRAEQAGSSPETFFAEGYRPYVATKEKAENTAYHHELDINLRKPKVIVGCGTYSDPYIIKDALQLKAIAELLNSADGTVDGMQIVLNVGRDGVIQPGETVTFGPQNGHTAGSVSLIPAETTPPETTGETGTTGSDTGETGTLTGSETGATVDTGSGETVTSADSGSGETSTETGGTTTPNYGDCQDVVFTCNGGNWTSYHTQADTLDGETVRTYVRNAYYKLEGNIELPSDWSGLGGFEPKKAFSGVIFGNGNTITLDSQGTFKQFGGLIKYSLGSVVKNLSIVYKNSITIQCDEVPTGVNANFFGGVVGWCMGGDTIIDEVTVTYKNALGVSGTYPYLAAVGGYVGLVGGTELGETQGYGGGVVFRSITSSGLTVPTGKDDHYYFNPYVGRVLDGYAVSEGTDFLNTDKNYTIPGIGGAPDGSHLSRETIGGKNTIIVNDDVGLWLLSAIANSGAGSAANCKAYTVGKARTCQYNTVGQAPNIGDLTDETEDTYVYIGGDESKYKAISYLTCAPTSLYNLTDAPVSIALSKNRSVLDMTRYGNGFRGIGTSYGDNSSDSGNYRLIKLSSLTGNSKTVTLAQDRKEYAAEKSNWTTMSTGLFTTLCCSGTVTISDLTLSGSTAIVYYNGATSSRKDDGNLLGIRLQRIGAGMLAGSMAKVSTAPSITISNVNLQNAVVNKNAVAQSNGIVENVSTFAGGLVGLAWNGSTGIQKLEVKDCSYNSLAVTGLANAGGLLGYVGATESDISILTGTDGAIQSTMSKCFSLNGTSRDGVGGLVGYCDGGKMDISGVNLRNLNVSANVQDDENNVGGLVGTWCVANNQSCSVTGITMKGTIELNGSRNSSKIKSNVGGIAGFATDANPNDWNTGTNKFNMSVTNFNIGNSGSDTVIIKNGTQIGGLFGLYKTGSDSNYGKVTLNDIHIGSSGSTVSLLTGTNITGDYAVSGLVGTLCLYPKVTVDAMVLTNVTILSGKYAAALFARTANQNGSNILTIDVRNTALDGCTVAIWAKNSAGFIYGRLDNNKTSFTGTNILIQNSTIGYLLSDQLAPLGAISEVPANPIVGLVNSSGKYCSYNTSGYSSYNDGTIGIFGGSHANTNKSFTMVGVSLWNNKTPTKDFGADPENGSYVIRADYLAKQTGNKNIFPDNAYCASPFVTTSPIMGFTGIGYRSGDGVAFVDGTTTPIAQGIVQNYLDSISGTIEENLIHFNVKEAIKTFCTETSTVNTSYFSTFKNAGENSLPANFTDFPVLVINSNEASKADRIVKNFISVLTNASSSLPTSIQYTAYKWDENGKQFVPLMDGSGSLTVTGKTISVDSNKHDNQKGQFTLLDVQYSDPANSTETAYHLYIPVLVKKVLEFRFHAAAKNSTIYNTAEYSGQSTQVVASHGEQITVLLTYEYLRTPAEWQQAVDNGDNLMWNFQKKIVLDNPLPAGTRLTLVDVNDQSKAYFYRGSGMDFSFDSFGLNVPEGTRWDASNAPLCDLLELSIDEGTSTDENRTKYVELTEEADRSSATVRTADGKYYRPAQGGEDGCYLKVGIGEFAQEQYYLTIQTPKGTTSITNVNVQCPDKLTPPDGIVQPTTRKDWGANKYSTGNENHIVLGNFFKQTVTVAAMTRDYVITEANNAIKAALTSEIRFDQANYENFIGYTNGLTLYQRFSLYLMKHEGNKPNPSSVPFTDGTHIRIDYGDGTSFDGEITGGEFFYPMEASEVNYGNSKDAVTTKTATVTLTYPDLEAIYLQFPQATSTDELGICIYAESSLGYSEDVLDRSSMRETAGDANSRYYREDSSLATLSYTVNTAKDSLNQLGINGLEGSSPADVYSIGTYDISALNNASRADTLQCIVKLYSKGDDGYYQSEVGKDTALQSLTIAPKVYLNGAYIPLSQDSSDGTSFDFTLGPGFNPYVPIQIEVDLKVKTGSDLENEALTYANYRVELTTMLLNGSTPIEGSQDSDFIIYTNAKVKLQMIS